MFMWKSYEKFASTTELHGFDQVLKFNKFWSAAWLCLSILAVGFCTNDVVNLVILYLSQPVTTSIEVRPIVNISLPNPTLCMEVHVDFPYDSTALDATNYTIPSMSDIDADVSAFLQATANADNLDISSYEELNLSDNLQYFTYLMLGQITEAELTYVGYSNAAFVAWETVMPFPYYRTGLVEYYTLEIEMKFNVTIGYIYHSYLKRNVNFVNLKRLIAMSICQKRTGQLTKQSGNETTYSRICKPRMITHLSFALVCSKLLENEVNESLVNYDNFTLNGTKLIERLSYDITLSQVPHTTYDVYQAPYISFAWHLDFQGRPTLPVGRQDIATWDPTTFSALEVFVVSENQFYNRRLNPCTDKELVFECDWRSRVEMLYDSCACRPSTLLFGINNVSLPPCSDNQQKPAWSLTNVSNIVTNPNFNGIECSGPVGNFSKISCMRNCWIKSFGIQRDAPSQIVKIGQFAAGSLPSGSIQFTLKLTNHTRLVISEATEKDFFSFMWDCGGTTGAWLGGSLMAFIHAISHLITTCYKCGKRLAGKDKNKEEIVDKTYM